MEVDETLGKILLGTFFAIMLYGITVTQTYLYSNDSGEDGLVLKLMVAGVLWVFRSFTWFIISSVSSLSTLETIHSGICIFNIYIMAVSNFGDFSSPGKIYWSEPALIVVGVLLMFSVHCFFVRRVWKICENPLIITAVISFLALSHLLFGLANCAVAYGFDTWDEFRASQVSLVVVCGGLGSSLTADVLIAGFLFCYLRRGRKESHKKFAGAINRLILYIVATGVLTAVTSAGTIVAFATDKHGGVFLGLATIQSKVYANSLLANLNSRRSIRDKLHSDSTDEEMVFTSVLLVGANSNFTAARSRRMAMTTWDPTIPESEDVGQRGPPNPPIVFQDNGTGARQPP
ncbi:hypothetical protein BV25DRAFT_1913603 [Artomyces pyxidatus]|uniref:Uncharacterized protein n=1 Tax=Artomyces pyxidatus TaxID=48021 RepID=A0ACB8T9U8_9AGAM|nr:hypothetical protein BV25DRAFT_1913603 [Artomyces pyxidatus]